MGSQLSGAYKLFLPLAVAATMTLGACDSTLGHCYNKDRTQCREFSGKSNVDNKLAASFSCAFLGADLEDGGCGGKESKGSCVTDSSGSVTVTTYYYNEVPDCETGGSSDAGATDGANSEDAGS